jgi:ADP-ribosylglycohydrolase
MRAAPIGLFYYDRPEEMIRVAHEQGWITHHDSRCSAGSVAIAGAVALAVQGDVKDISEFASRLSEWMSGYDRGFAAMVLELPTWVSLDPNEAAREIAGAGKPKGYVDGWPEISPFVVPSVLWSLYAFLRYLDSYQSAISEAIAVGGDVDTTAAMTGAISGAYLGLQALPNHLVTKLQDQGEWKYLDLVKLAEECYRSRL